MENRKISEIKFVIFTLWDSNLAHYVRKLVITKFFIAVNNC